MVSKTVARAAFSANQIQLGAPPTWVNPVAPAAPQQQSQTAARSGMARVGGGGSSSSSSAPSSSNQNQNQNQTAIPLPCPPALFRARSNSKQDVDYQKDQSEVIGSLLDAMLDAVVFAHYLWRFQAYFSDIRIMAVTASGGKLNGPNLETFIRTAPTVCQCMGNPAKLRDAVAKGVGECFAQWQRGVSVPGLPWYPTFAACPKPVAPPTPNIPTPLISCPSPQMARITTPGPLKDQMKMSLSGAVDHSDAFFGAIAAALAPAFMAWLPQQQITQVLGKGPVPSFAPPYMPVGPVVGGDVIAAPSHLSA
jgi:hypothetical protein